MVATFALIEYNGASNVPGSGASTLHLNLGSTNAINQTAMSTQIVAGNNSFEKWVRCRFTSDGSTSQANNIRLFLSGGSLPAGVSLYVGYTTSYTTPTANTSSVATNAVPTSYDDATVSEFGNTSIGANGAQTLSPRYVVIQLRTQASTEAGRIPRDGSTLTFTIQYDEL